MVYNKSWFTTFGVQAWALRREQVRSRKKNTKVKRDDEWAGASEDELWSEGKIRLRWRWLGRRMKDSQSGGGDRCKGQPGIKVRTVPWKLIILSFFQVLVIIIIFNFFKYSGWLRTNLLLWWQRENYKKQWGERSFGYNAVLAVKLRRGPLYFWKVYTVTYTAHTLQRLVHLWSLNSIQGFHLWERGRILLIK